VIGPTPFLDFFKRGDVARDVRLLAAQGALAPRAHEQLAILVLLLEDPDAEIRRTADHTLTLIPLAALTAFLVRSDVPVGLREFFGDRGIFPEEIPAIELADDSDLPLIDTAPVEPAVSDDDDQARGSMVQRLAEMSFTDRLKAAIKGSREMRAILVRDTNKMIAAAVLSSPRLTDSEVESFARMTSVGEEVLRVIGNNRGWMKRYGIVVGLTKNPKTPVAMSLNLMSRLNDRDVAMLAVDRNVPEPLRAAARRRVSDATSRK
jgi:hypothetical protein